MSLGFVPFSATPSLFRVHSVHAGDSAEMESRLSNEIAAALTAGEVNLADLQISGAASGFDWEAYFVTTSLSVADALALGFVVVPLSGVRVAAVVGDDPAEVISRLNNRLLAVNMPNIHKVAVAGAGDGPRYMVLAAGSTGAVPIPVPPTSTFGSFFSLMPGDNPATVAADAGVRFQQLGPANGILKSAALDPVSGAADTQIIIPATGIYQVSWQVSVTEPGQLMLDLNHSIANTAHTVAGRATGTSQIMNDVLISAVANDLLRVVNPVGNAAALTITPTAGGTHAVGAMLVIKRIQ